MDNSVGDANLFDALKDTSFNEFVTLKLIKFIYIIGLAAIAIGVVLTVLGALSQGFLIAVGALVLGSIGALFAVLMLRVYLEIMVVVFRVAANTAKIADRTEKAYSPIFVHGGCGLGKSHLATALGLAACHQGHSVLFASTVPPYAPCPIWCGMAVGVLPPLPAPPVVERAIWIRNISACASPASED